MNIATDRSIDRSCVLIQSRTRCDSRSLASHVSGFPSRADHYCMEAFRAPRRRLASPSSNCSPPFAPPHAWTLTLQSFPAPRVRSSPLPLARTPQPLSAWPRPPRFLATSSGDFPECTTRDAFAATSRSITPLSAHSASMAFNLASIASSTQISSNSRRCALLDGFQKIRDKSRQRFVVRRIQSRKRSNKFLHRRTHIVSHHSSLSRPSSLSSRASLARLPPPSREPAKVSSRSSSTHLRRGKLHARPQRARERRTKFSHANTGRRRGLFRRHRRVRRV